jgi:protein-disulfide isomerase
MPSVDRVPGSGRKDNRVKVGIIVATVIVAVFVAAFILVNRPWGSTQPVAATYPVAVDGVVVAAGQPTAPVTVDVYEDFLCPFCERFETRNRDALTTALNEGRVKVNYHALNILDARTTPPGYSTLAANAALCAVPAGIWPAYHERLFAEQPAEGSAGLTAAQLSAFGTELGAGPGFTQCVEANGNAAAITAATEAASANPALQTDGQFGTPTIAVDGRKIDVSDSDWLQTALAGS